jgi:hypothetical protein
MTSPHPFTALMRRYVVDYLVCQNPSVCAQIMSEDYELRMADAILGPRDSVYVPAVAAQLAQFPGMGMTVHALWLSGGDGSGSPSRSEDPHPGDHPGDHSGDRLAMLFSQHGASVAHNGAVAGWMGIGIYRWDGNTLTSNTAIEDYEGRRQQLAGSVAPAVLPGPMLAPWDAQPGIRSESAESALATWVSDPKWMTSPALDVDSGTRQPFLFDVTQTHVVEIASSHDQVAFAARVEGRYISGLDVPDSCIGMGAELHVMGMVTVDRLTSMSPTFSGLIVRGRGPLRRSLLKALASTAG